ncbi:MAG: hypothetical protein O2994_11905, partial [Proteobacteria bacterium]|nr:hypothetical protein [Pseudomonadota bacterium]
RVGSSNLSAPTINPSFGEISAIALWAVALALHAPLVAQDWRRSVDNSCHQTEFTAKPKETKTFFAALRVRGCGWFGG